MNYKLALKLRDAGYEDENSINCYEHDMNRDESIPNPTIDELLKACGDHFFQLTNWNGQWFVDSPELGSPNREISDTPEEAMVNFWIKIHS